MKIMIDPTIIYLEYKTQKIGYMFGRHRNLLRLLNRYLGFVLFVFFANKITAQGTHFKDTGYSGDTYSIVIQEITIDGQTIEIGDEVAVYDEGEEGLGINTAIVYDGIKPFAILSKLYTIVGNDTLLGARRGNSISFRVWDSSTSTEYDGIPVFETGGKFGEGFATNVSIIECVSYSTISILKDEIFPEIPHLLIFQNYPNPFNPATKIIFKLLQKRWVLLDIYNLLGDKVSELLNEEMPPGYYEIEFNAHGLASGIYFYRIQSNDFLEIKKIVLMR